MMGFSNLYSNSNRQDGFTIVELLVAVGVVVVVMVAVASGVSTSLKNSRYSKEKAASVRHAQEAIEQIRLVRDKEGWGAFTAELVASNVGKDASAKTICLDNFEGGIMSKLDGTEPDHVGGCSEDMVIVDTDFKREMTVSYDDTVGNENVELEVVVSWDDGNGDKTTTLNSRLREWK